jgi:hypothetical protein
MFEPHFTSRREMPVQEVRDGGRKFREMLLQELVLPPKRSDFEVNSLHFENVRLWLTSLFRSQSKWHFVHFER